MCKWGREVCITLIGVFMGVVFTIVGNQLEMRLNAPEVEMKLRNGQPFLFQVKHPHGCEDNPQYLSYRLNVCIHNSDSIKTAECCQVYLSKIATMGSNEKFKAPDSF